MIVDSDKISCKTATLLITNISIATAYRYIQHCRDYLHKQKHEILTVGEFKHYYGLK